jgi:hypothetical protein
MSNSWGLLAHPWSFGYDSAAMLSRTTRDMLKETATMARTLGVQLQHKESVNPGICEPTVQSTTVKWDTE